MRRTRQTNAPIKDRVNRAPLVRDTSMDIISATTTLTRDTYLRFDKLAKQLGLSKSALLRNLVEREVEALVQ